MNKMTRKLVFKFLIFLFIGSFAPIYVQSDLLAWDIVGVKAGDFAPGRLHEHYLKHGYQFGQVSQEQYLQGAQALLDALPGDDVLQKIRPNGDVEHFRVSTGEFAVMTKRGRIRTFYKTSFWYWTRH